VETYHFSPQVMKSLCWHCCENLRYNLDDYKFNFKPVSLLYNKQAEIFILLWDLTPFLVNITIYIMLKLERGNKTQIKKLQFTHIICCNTCDCCTYWQEYKYPWVFCIRSAVGNRNLHFMLSLMWINIILPWKSRSVSSALVTFMYKLTHQAISLEWPLIFSLSCAVPDPHIH
jgi:hypothetical protein